MYMSLGSFDGGDFFQSSLTQQRSSIKCSRDAGTRLAVDLCIQAHRHTQITVIGYQSSRPIYFVWEIGSRSLLRFFCLFRNTLEPLVDCQDIPV